MKPMKLTIELVPISSWYRNVRSNVSRERWDELRFECYNKAKFLCEICGEDGNNQGYDHKVECHEIWDYNDETHVQKLIGLIALCPLCHKTKHSGFAGVNGEEELVIKHLMKVNNMDEYQAKSYLKKVFGEWDRRSEHNWTVDISFLKKKKTQIASLLSKMNKFRKN